MIARRKFMQVCAVGAAIPATATFGNEQDRRLTIPLANEVGITTSSLSGHLVVKPKLGQFSLVDLPKIMRNELDLRVIDLNTSSIASNDPKYLDCCREEAEKAGCVFTNLKLNQRGLDMNSADESVRNKALAEYKKSIDAAARLGCRWARPLPRPERPDMTIHVASYRELADHAADKNIQILVENFGWMESDRNSVPKLIKAIDRNVAASPDTGNWKNDEVRYKGLAAAFPLAVTCDFKARAIDADGRHPLYDLKKCFEVGWDAGFRGPWCLEHANRDRKALFRELVLLRDMLRKWMDAKA